MLGLLHECHKQTRQCGNVFRPTRLPERLLTHVDLILIDFKTFACKAPAAVGGGQNGAPPPRQPIRRCAAGRSGAERGLAFATMLPSATRGSEVNLGEVRFGVQTGGGAGCVMDEVSCDARRCNIDEKPTWSCREERPPPNCCSLQVLSRSKPFLAQPRSSSHSLPLQLQVNQKLNSLLCPITLPPAKIGIDRLCILGGQGNNLAAKRGNSSPRRPNHPTQLSYKTYRVISRLPIGSFLECTLR